MERSAAQPRVRWGFLSFSLRRSHSPSDMSTDISDLGLPFCGEVIGFNAESLKENTTPASESLELAFEFHDPVPPYHPASEEVLKVVNDTIKSPQAKSELQKAIRDLGDSAHSIEVCFNNIADDLRKAQMQGTDAQKQQLKTFANNWAICHKEYVRLLWESRRVAGHARATANDFAGDFINLMTASNVTLPEKKQEIQAYRKQLQEDVKKSSNLSQGFYDLRNAADQFQRDVLAFLRPDHKLESRVETLKDNLGKIRREIDHGASLTPQLSLVLEAWQQAALQLVYCAHFCGLVPLCSRIELSERART